jgi:ribonucleoside-diphosphate reductase alpha chain
MRDAKVWPFPQRRAMSNNSAVYQEKPDAITFLQEWASLAKSGTGERGIFNISTIQKQVPKRRDASKIAGVNPCGEIMLRSFEFCNLSSVVIRPEDDLDSLLEKVETATWIGAIQSTFTDFKYLRKTWKKNCEEERLLGVSLSGQMDNPKLLTPDVLKALKARANKVAKKAAEKLGANYSVAITCVKPEGTSSQLTYSGSGLHVWYAPYFIRRYRISSTDPLYKMLKSQNFKMNPENGQIKDSANTWVIEFPMKAPEGSLTKKEVSALDQLEHYKKLQENWCEHNASCTVYIKDEEWFEVGNWVYKNWDIVNGLSFLQSDGGKYQQAPLEEITKEQYEKMIKDMAKIDYSKLSEFEKDDETQGSRELACIGGYCEL